MEQLITDFLSGSTLEAERAGRAIMTKDGGAKVAQRSTLPPMQCNAAKALVEASMQHNSVHSDTKSSCCSSVEGFDGKVAAHGGPPASNL